MTEGRAANSGDDLRRYVIFNADDFGQTPGITRGIVQCHREGVVTSTSLMVTGAAVDEAVAASKENPHLAIGLHFDLCGEDERDFDTTNISATRDEFYRQLDHFIKLTGRKPTHVDSHRHVHREERLFQHVLEWVRPLEMPLRGDGQVRYMGGFYAQWEWKVVDLKYVSVPFLKKLLLEESPPGYTEFSCHPGYVTPDYVGIYRQEREAEIRTLTDPAIRKFIEEEKIELISFEQVQRSGT
jgi:predicted glycoside hydrolase/deacetylase ChbG (UPF0249 family)